MNIAATLLGAAGNQPDESLVIDQYQELIDLELLRMGVFPLPR
jgi:hypothetical protein